MDISLFAGMGIAFSGIIMGFLIEGGSIGALFQLTAALIVFGGTIGATMASFTIKDVMATPKMIKDATKLYSTDKLMDLVDTFVTMSEKARREGLLTLESEFEKGSDMEVADPLVTQGIKLVVDGTDPELVRDILENSVHVWELKMKRQIALFTAAGGFSPTMGIVGTVMGLISILAHLSTDVVALAKGISLAFIATFYGIMFANVVYLPIANKIKLNLSYMKLQKELIIEGVLGIQAGHNPSIVREKLETFLGDEKVERKTPEAEE